MSRNLVGWGRGVVLGVCLSWMVGCAPRASDVDIQEVCALRASCGSMDITCLPGLRAQRDNADEVGCAGELAAAVSCEKSDGTCMAVTACRAEYQRAAPCAGSSPGAADPARFCESYRTYFCSRELSGGRLPESEYAACTRRTSLGGTYEFCTGFSFACTPTQRRADQCINALDTTPVSVPTANVTECDLCE